MRAGQQDGYLLLGREGDDHPAPTGQRNDADVFDVGAGEAVFGGSAPAKLEFPQLLTDHLVDVVGRVSKSSVALGEGQTSKAVSGGPLAPLSPFHLFERSAEAVVFLEFAHVEDSADEIRS